MVQLAARGGLLARGLLYLLLAYLAASLAAGWGNKPANANGALTTVAAQPAGWAALAGAAVGFGAFGLMRLAGAYGDRTVGRLRRLSTAGQAVCYLAMSAVTVSFLVGDRGAGSTRQSDSTAVLLASSTGGRLLMAAVGLFVVCVCGWQLRLAWQGGYAVSLDTAGMSEKAQVAAEVVGRVGIIARAAAVLPWAPCLRWRDGRPARGPPGTSTSCWTASCRTLSATCWCGRSRPASSCSPSIA
jgi:hypothetical protein